MTSQILFAASWFGGGMPSFDWTAAVVVGVIVVAGAAIILTGGIATPFIAIQAGATIKATVVAVALIATATGVVAGAAAGWYWGSKGDARQREEVDKIATVSNQLDIYFEPAGGDPKRAADFTCTVVVYEETDLQARPPTVTTRRTTIKATNAQDFYDQVETQIKRWLGTRVEADRRGQPRKMVVYMNPFPGEGVYDRIKEATDRASGGRCVVQKNEGVWASAVPK